MTKRSQNGARLYQGEPVLAPPSPWWTIVALVPDEGWVELYQARTEDEGKRYLAIALDDSAPHMEKYADIGLYPPQLASTVRIPQPMSAQPARRSRAGRVRRK